MKSSESAGTGGGNESDNGGVPLTSQVKPGVPSRELGVAEKGGTRRPLFAQESGLAAARASRTGTGAPAITASRRAAVEGDLLGTRGRAGAAGGGGW